MKEKRFPSVPEFSEGDAIAFEAKVKSSEICYIQGLTEAYEGLAAVRTKNSAEGIIQFWVPKSSQKIFLEFIDSIKEEAGIYSLEIVEEKFLGPY